MNLINDETGNILTQREEAVKRWAEYCETLYCDDRMQDERVLCELEEISPPPQEASENSVLKDEIIMAISKLKNNKGVGIDGIPAELIKHGGDAITNQIYKLTEMIWSEENIPEEWSKAVLVTIPKKGDLLNCANYRTSSLLPHMSKVF